MRNIFKRRTVLGAVLCVALQIGAAQAQDSMPEPRGQTLKQAMEMAYQSNPSLAAERTALKNADERVAMARGGYRPSIDAKGSIGQVYDSYNNASTTTSQPKQMAVEITQPIFQGFRTDGAVEQANFDVMARRALLNQAEQGMLLNVGQAFLDVTEAAARLNLAEANKDVLAKQLEHVKARFEVGEVTQTDVSQAQSRYQRSVATHIAAKGALKQARASYARHVGTEAGALAQAQLVLSDQDNLEAVIEKADKNNPLIQAALYNEHAAKAGVKMAKGALLPEIALVGQVGRSFDQSSDFPEKRDTAQIMAMVTVPLYRAGNDYAATRAAYNSVTEQKLRLNAARDQVKEGAVQAWQAFLTAKASVLSTKAEIEAAEMALYGVKKEAEVGTRTILDVLNAEQELLDAKLALLQAEKNESYAVLLVKASTGDLTAKALGLNVDLYDPNRHYDAVQSKWFGFGSN